MVGACQPTMPILVPICTGPGKPEMDHSGNVNMPEGTGKYAGCVIETTWYLCLVILYGCIVTMMVGVHRMMPETVPPYSGEGSIVPEQKAGGVKVGSDILRLVAPPTTGSGRQAAARASQLPHWAGAGSAQ